MGKLLFGRRVRISIGDMVVVDLDPRVSETINEQRNLHVDFTCSSHAKPEPLVCTVRVWGLSAATRRKMSALNDEARRIAWQRYQAVVVGDVLVEPEQVDETAATLVSQGSTVIVEAGYDDDMGIIHRGIVLPEGLKHERGEGHYVTTINSQDNRLAWKNAFVSEEVAPGVSLVDYNKALRISEQFLAGEVGGAEVEAQAPGLIERDLEVFGYENGKVTHGHTRDENEVLMDTLGLRPFLVNGAPFYLPIDAVLYDEAVVLQEVPEDITIPSQGGVLDRTELARGFQQVRCLLNHRLSAGRQVVLLDALGRPISTGRFRVEHAEHAGSTYSLNYYSVVTLRPTTILPQANF